ncbi:MAG: hypothetical protein HYX83_02395, partial [Chloroflexi bacterium]|nr:hypothetical protein [Chloroflexota bacterium]
MKDPFFPENQLPYVDGVKSLIIADISTREAAVRTGKADYGGTLPKEQAENLIKTNPELKYVKIPSASPSGLAWRVDKPELPFYDKRVRQALSMAVDRQAIIKAIYGGDGDWYAYPVRNMAEYAHFYTPLEKLPDSAREVLELHPDKAKQLLADAGYPNGFKTSVLTTAAYVDILSIIKDNWSKVGVDLSIDVKETAVYTAGWIALNFEIVTFSTSTSGTFPFTFFSEDPGMRTYTNTGQVNDPVINEALKKVQGDDYFDPAKKAQHMRDLTPYMVENSFNLSLPVGWVYTFWTPWVKNYNGEQSIGYIHGTDFERFIWYDQDLKFKMTGRR